MALNLHNLAFIDHQIRFLRNKRTVDWDRNDQVTCAADEGHLGLPCMLLDGETFFGQDRIEALKWRMGLVWSQSRV
jgi:2-hydroxychromene-2-carboxylate isomerase